MADTKDTTEQPITVIGMLTRITLAQADDQTEAPVKPSRKPRPRRKRK
jgi:hypothetical protein